MAVLSALPTAGRPGYTLQILAPPRTRPTTRLWVFRCYPYRECLNSNFKELIEWAEFKLQKAFC
jgi:hypothetical protein